MTFITFMYRIGKNRKIYYGKYYSDYVSDDHDGLDMVVLHVLAKGLNEYRKQKKMPKLNKKHVYIGIISFSFEWHIPVDSTETEIKFFDFYHTYNEKTYINGKILKKDPIE